MISEKEYREHSLTWWEGKKVRLIKEIKNGCEIMPKGAIMEIRGKRSGFELYSEVQCPCCGYGTRHEISRVSPSKLELVKEDSS